MYVELTGQSAATVLSPEGMLAELELLTSCVPKTLNPGRVNQRREGQHDSRSSMSKPQPGAGEQVEAMTARPKGLRSRTD